MTKSKKILKATIQALDIWKRKVIKKIHGYKIWVLPDKQLQRCPLCFYRCQECPLYLIGERCYEDNRKDPFSIAVDKKNKKPLILALKKAVAFQALKVFEEECENTVKKLRAMIK